MERSLLVRERVPAREERIVLVGVVVEEVVEGGGRV